MVVGCGGSLGGSVLVVCWLCVGCVLLLLLLLLLLFL